MKNLLTLALTVLVGFILYKSMHQENFVEVFGFAGSEHPNIISNTWYTDNQKTAEYTVKRLDVGITPDGIAEYVQKTMQYFKDELKACIHITQVLNATIYAKDDESTDYLLDISFMATITDATTPYSFVIYAQFDSNNTIVSMRTQSQLHLDYLKSNANAMYDENYTYFPHFDKLAKEDLAKIVTDISKLDETIQDEYMETRILAGERDSYIDRFINQLAGSSSTITYNNTQKFMTSLNALRMRPLSTTDIDKLFKQWASWNPETKKFDRAVPPNVDSIQTDLLIDALMHDSSGGSDVLSIPKNKLRFI